MKARYLNVDCILRSNHNLSSVISFLAGNIFILWDKSVSNDSYIGFETMLTDSKEPEEDINELLRLFDSLPPELSDTLNNCYEKIIDIGFESGNSDQPLDVRISSEEIQRLSGLGFSINIRIYPIMN